MDRAPDRITAPLQHHPRTGDPALEARLKKEIRGEVLFDAATRGRYSTDASIYQIEPVGVVVPATEEDAKIAIQIAADEGIPILPRGAGSSQCGQTVGAALVIDTSRFLNKLIDVDTEQRTAIVQPGLVLDTLNAQLKKHNLWFPVDVSTSAQATLGGMTGNNSCGSRSIRYGNMVHNVLGVDALLADGREFHFGPHLNIDRATPEYRSLAHRIQAVVRREADEIIERWPKVLRRVQGYNLDMILPDHNGHPRPHNLAHLLVGSEGTLAWSRRIHLKLSPLPTHKTLGVCHFKSFYEAMQAPQHIVKLTPSAVELVDRTMLRLARSNPAFRPVLDRCVTGDPDAILLVEFAGEDAHEQITKLKQLVELMADLGHPGAVIEIPDPKLQRDLWEVRKAGLNIMMSMKGEGKPVSFIEDCAVPLEHLAEYTQRLTEVFHKHGTEGTWYAHASVGTLHVRPILNMKAEGAKQMRAIAEEACALVREYKGAYSGEHGDGLVRSEWIEPIIGPRLTAVLGEIKDILDPRGLMNPGKIVKPPKQDDRSLFRFKPEYKVVPIKTALDWSEWVVKKEGGSSADAPSGFGAAIEMCNNNGHCRKFDAGTMCPSFRATGNEQDLTRGRANTVRLALSGQIAGLDGADALTSDAVREAMDLCVSCKGCKRECPTGVDMAKMKLEFIHHDKQKNGLTLRDKIIGNLPKYGPLASRFPMIANTVSALAKPFVGFAGERSLPKWRKDTGLVTEGGGFTTWSIGEVVLFIDTFSNYFDPENARAASKVLQYAGYDVHIVSPEEDEKPICCGRTLLATGRVEEARAEAKRLLNAVRRFTKRDVPILGLEPSCLFTLKDEFLSMQLGPEAEMLAKNAMLFEEFLAREHAAGKLKLRLRAIDHKKALLHGHCHQKAFGAMSAVQTVLGLVPGLKVETVESSCCGMAGSFGYEKEHYEVSMKMAEAALLPAVRKADPDTLLVADGTSCRHQIADGTRREAMHVARVLEMAADGWHDGPRVGERTMD